MLSFGWISLCMQVISSASGTGDSIGRNKRGP